MTDYELAKNVRQAQEALNAALKSAAAHGLKIEVITSEYRTAEYKDSTDPRDRHPAVAVWANCWRHTRDN